MKVFVTGATGFIGSAIVQELIRSGHQVVGLARSEAAAIELKKKGAQVHRGDLEDVDSLRRGAETAEGVIHTGFIHDFSRFKEVCEIDRCAIRALGEPLIGSRRPMIITSGTLVVRPGHVATEEMIPDYKQNHHPRVASEAAADELASKGVLLSVVRLSPSVDGDGDHGLFRC